ncbi:hypothetical protein [Nonomuraea rubra]|uniref:hypothetical protein n=1 Tax=Nonomuraea rubra TaxID=46180 RepID=UPI0031EE48A2
MASLRTHPAPARQSIHLPWLKAVRPAGWPGLDLSELFALVPPGGYLADFITAAARHADADFAAELDRVRRTDPALARQEALEGARHGPGRHRTLAPTPRPGCPGVADALRRTGRGALRRVLARVYAPAERGRVWRAARASSPRAGRARAVCRRARPACVQWTGWSCAAHRPDPVPRRAGFSHADVR